jgi:hypothetical protein
MNKPSLIAAHADWSLDPRKRQVSIARCHGGAWRAEAPVTVGDPAALVRRLLAEGPPLVIGLDLPLGLPRAYAAGRPEAGFLPFLRGLGSSPAFFDVAPGLDSVSIARPFYPARGMKGMTRASHAAALGMAGPGSLSRLCDLATTERPAGAPLFWTLGANQTGKAAISAWRDWLAPALVAVAPYRIWPFEGDLRSLMAPGIAVLAETYPAEAMRHLGVKLAGSKRVRESRRMAGPSIRLAMQRLGVEASAGLDTDLTEGFGGEAVAEDRFDSLLGLLCVVGVLTGARPDFVPDDPWVRHWEGWVLGQTAQPDHPAPLSWPHQP